MIFRYVYCVFLSYMAPNFAVVTCIIYRQTWQVVPVSGMSDV